MNCIYYREDEITQYTPECTGVDWSIHPEDCEVWVYCPFCGKRITYKEFTAIPIHLTHNYHE